MAEAPRARVRRQRRELAGVNIDLAAKCDADEAKAPATWETIHAAYSRWTDEEVDAAIAAAAEEDGA